MKATLCITDLELINKRFNQWTTLVGFKHNIKPTEINLYRYKYSMQVKTTYTNKTISVSAIFQEYTKNELQDEVIFNGERNYIDVTNCLN